MLSDQGVPRGTEASASSPEGISGSPEITARSPGASPGSPGQVRLLLQVQLPEEATTPVPHPTPFFFCCCCKVVPNTGVVTIRKFIVQQLETCTPVNFTCYTSTCSAAALPVAANGMLLQAGRCTDCCLMVKLALTGLSHCFFDSDTQFPQV